MDTTPDTRKAKTMTKGVTTSLKKNYTTIIAADTKLDSGTVGNQGKFDINRVRPGTAVDYPAKNNNK